jgi:RNA polymerase sigma factor (sigma-70 family)
MQAKSDVELLADYANLGQEAAFAELVQRHSDLVYSSAVRQTQSSAIAAELTQQVFISLARQSRLLAGTLQPDASLAGWLCRSARNLSLNHKRDEFRRNIREREAMQQLAADPEAATGWQQLSLVLDDAMADLNDSDYDAVVMRFYQNQDLRSVGQAFGVTDDAAQKRISRALEKLRALLSRRGITGTAAAISLTLSANAVQAAPPGLAAAISSEVSAAALGTATLSSSATATKLIAMTALQKAAVVTLVTAAIGVAAYKNYQANAFRQQAAAEAGNAEQLRLDYASATNELASLRSGTSLGLAGSDPAELLRLRAEVARLQRQLDEPDFSGTIGTIIGLKRKLKEMPDKDIPEIHYLDDDRWLRMVLGPGYGVPTRAVRAAGGPEWTVQWDDQESVRRALMRVRREAKTQFSGRIQRALQSYTQEHQGELPSDMLQLQPYLAAQPDTSVAMGPPHLSFGPNGTVPVASQPERQYLPPVDDSTLRRYEMATTGTISNLRPSQYVVSEKAPVDNDFDTLVQIGLKGWFVSGVGRQRDIGWSGDLDLAGLTPEQRESYEKGQEARRVALERTEALRASQPNAPAQFSPK